MKKKPHVASVPKIEIKGRKKKVKEPTQVDPRGVPVMIIKANGKSHMGWKK